MKSKATRAWGNQTSIEIQTPLSHNIPDPHGTTTSEQQNTNQQRYCLNEVMETYPRLASTKESSFTSNNHLP